MTEDDPLADAIVDIGDACPPRGKYKVKAEDLLAIKKRLDNMSGPHPYLTLSGDWVRREMGGGTEAPNSCVMFYINKRIAEDPELAKHGIFAHTAKENIRFDRVRPSELKAKEE